MRKFFLVLIAVAMLNNVLFAQDIPAEENAGDVAQNEEAVEDEKDQSAKKDSAAQEEDAKTDKESEEIEEQGYNLKLRNLEENINSLKDKIFRSKQRLAILQETVLSGSIAGARAKIVHLNNVGHAFRLVSAIYYLDDAPVFKRINQPEDLSQPEIVVFEGSVVPGPHHVSAYYVYQGKGFGIFSYMKGYTLKIKSGHSFIVEEGNIVEITVSPGDRGGSRKIDDRLYISFDVSKKMYQAEFKNDEELTSN
jgi:hypothetical protein